MRILWGLIVVLVTTGISAAGFAIVTALNLGGGLMVVMLSVAGVMFVYGIVAAVLGSYDLTTGVGWLALLVDCTWSLPNSVFGAVIGLPLYLIFGSPSSAQSRGEHWVSYAPRAGTGFGHNVLQTLGTVNLGGAGQHERMHLLQARIFGPLYLPLFGVFYALTFLIQGLFTLVLGLILKATGVRASAALQPPRSSAVQGFWGWVYYATPFEVWAYASGNP